VQALTEEHGFLVLRGMEVNTELGHIAIFGLPELVGGLHKIDALRRVADEVGGFLVALHPFRRLLTPSRNNRGELVEPVDYETALTWPVWGYVDAIEVLNGANTDDENALAYRVAQALGKPGTGGSDAHSIHGMGCFTTCFEDTLRSDQDLLEALKAGAFYPAQGLLGGNLTRYEPDLEEASL
ncbi:MAG TPA: PHP domain-containing protein, partial [Dehalococcoidia bacterium]|nr:PHP domain-containing protein [Dehalococcoidia bacterium]